MHMPRRRHQAYPTDLTDCQWEAVEPMIPDAAPGGRPRKADKREPVEAILYIPHAGCASRLLPYDFAPWQTVY
jgi:putative transposase